MHKVLVLAIGTAVFHVVVTLAIQTVRRWISVRKFSKSRGLRTARTEQSWDILGIRKVARAGQAVWTGDMLGYMDELWMTHGETYASSFFGHKVIFTCDASNIKQVLVSRWGDYDAAKGLRKNMFKYLAPGAIAAQDGHYWKELRSMWRHQFSSLNDMFDIEAQEENFQKMIKMIPAGDTVDVQELFRFLMTDLMTSVMLGDSIGCLDPDQPEEKKEFVEALEHVSEKMAKDGFLGPGSLLLGRKKQLKATAFLQKYVERIIRQKLEEKHLREKSGVAKDGAVKQCVLDSLMERTSDVLELRTAVLSLLVGANVSVGVLLSTVIWVLARDDRIFQKLRKSVLEATGFEPPSFQKMRSFTYLNHVLLEVLRLYPPLPFNARIANKDTWLGTGGGASGQDPLLVKSGQCIVFSAWGSQRSTRNFGSDALEFKPERWEHLKIETPGYFPFLLGPRQCLGQQFAMLEATYATVRFLQVFSHIENRDPDLALKPEVRLSLLHKDGVLVAFTPETHGTTA